MSEKKIGSEPHKLEIDSDEMEGVTGGKGAYCKTFNTLVSMVTRTPVSENSCGTWMASTGPFDINVTNGGDDNNQEEEEPHETVYIG